MTKLGRRNGFASVFFISSNKVFSIFPSISVNNWNILQHGKSLFVAPPKRLNRSDWLMSIHKSWFHWSRPDWYFLVMRAFGSGRQVVTFCVFVCFLFLSLFSVFSLISHSLWSDMTQNSPLHKDVLCCPWQCSTLSRDSLSWWCLGPKTAVQI